MVNKYDFHPVGDETKDVMQRVRDAFLGIDQIVNMYCPESRERSVAITHLETAAMWAIKSIGVNAK